MTRGAKSIGSEMTGPQKFGRGLVAPHIFSFEIKSPSSSEQHITHHHTTPISPLFLLHLLSPQLVLDGTCKQQAKITSKMSRQASAALAAVSVLLSFATAPCAVVGRTHLRGGLVAPENPEKQGVFGGKRLRGGGDGGRKLQAAPAPAPAAISTPPATAAPTAAPTAAGSGHTPPREPKCNTLFVPNLAGNLTGYYTFNGRFNSGRPVYANEATGNHIFYEFKSSNESTSSFFITQPSEMMFLSLETDVYELAELEGLQPWVRNNDAACSTAACIWNIRIACADAAMGTPAPTTAATATTLNTNSTSPAEPVTPAAAPATAAPSSLSTDTSTIEGCMSLNIKNGAERTGVYMLNTTAADRALLINGRPSYVGVGTNRTADRVFTGMMDVCPGGYGGVVDADWAADVGNLSVNATAQAVFLMYAAEYGGLASTVVDCKNQTEVPAWFVTSGGSEDLETAGEYTFLSLSDVEDPTEATTWAKFTPATTGSRATLVDSSLIDVACADANEVEEALEGDEEAGTGAGAGAGAAAGAGEGVGEDGETDVPPVPAPVGSEPNGRRLRVAYVD